MLKYVLIVIRNEILPENKRVGLSYRKTNWELLAVNKAGTVKCPTTLQQARLSGQAQRWQLESVKNPDRSIVMEKVCSEARTGIPQVRVSMFVVKWLMTVPWPPSSP